MPHKELRWLRARAIVAASSAHGCCAYGGLHHLHLRIGQEVALM